MTARTSRLLVIDASVLQAASETEHLVSSACRDALLAVLRICHRAAFTEAVRDEWKRHMSGFSRKWWRSMAAHRKALECVRPTQLDPDDIDAAGLSDADRQAIEKDRCLLEAALSADRIIVTRDDSLRRALAKTRPSKRVQSIKWLNPVTDGAASLETL